MILEVAEIYVLDGQGTALEAGIKESAVKYISKTEGYIRHELQRSTEDPNRYLLLIQWETVEAHTINFREGPNFEKHRALISPTFAKPPFVQHFELVK